MATLAQTLVEEPDLSAPPKNNAQAEPAAKKAWPVLKPWIAAQGLNVARHTAALRPFRQDEFGKAAEAPTPGHVAAVNKLILQLRHGLTTYSNRVRDAVALASQNPNTVNLQTMVNRKEQAHRWVQGVEKIWDFYFELFGQRQSPYAKWLLSCDRIALDCYRTAYLGLGMRKTIPAPPPFSYMRTGFSPATFRRGIPLTRLGKQLNPFPLIELPYHRLVNPWTLGAVLHELSHNLQTDLGLSKPIPRRIASQLLHAGIPRPVAIVWTRWNREMFADMCALLLGGPEVVGSLMDVIARGTQTVVHFNRRGVHPTPFLRMLTSVELLRRMGFNRQADLYRSAWHRIYPKSSTGNIPSAMLKTFHKACPIAVDAMVFRSFPELGGKSLAQVIPFGAKEQGIIEEAAGRLAAGTDPGIIPERFVIGAARLALNRRLASPGVIGKNFYQTLANG